MSNRTDECSDRSEHPGQAGGARALPSDPNDLLTPEQHADLNAGLARLANQRRRVEAESRCLPMH